MFPEAFAPQGSPIVMSHGRRGERVGGDSRLGRSRRTTARPSRGRIAGWFNLGASAGRLAVRLSLPSRKRGVDCRSPRRAHRSSARRRQATPRGRRRATPARTRRRPSGTERRYAGCPRPDHFHERPSGRRRVPRDGRRWVCSFRAATSGSSTAEARPYLTQAPISEVALAVGQCSGCLLSPYLAAASLECQKEFTEPVALLSTRPGDRPLPRRASRESFDLLALRARCERQPTVAREARQDGSRSVFRILRRFSLGRAGARFAAEVSPSCATVRECR